MSYKVLSLKTSYNFVKKKVPIRNKAYAKAKYRTFPSIFYLFRILVFWEWFEVNIENDSSMKSDIDIKYRA